MGNDIPTSTGTQKKLDIAKEIWSKLVPTVAKSDVSVTVFDSNSHVRLSLESHTEAALKGVYWDASGGTYLWKMLVDDLQLKDPDSMIIVITDGDDTNSPTPYRGPKGIVPCVDKLRGFGFSGDIYIIGLGIDDETAEVYEQMAGATGGGFVLIDPVNDPDWEKKVDEFSGEIEETVSDPSRRKARQEERKAAHDKRPESDVVGERIPSIPSAPSEKPPPFTKIPFGGGGGDDGGGDEITSADAYDIVIDWMKKLGRKPQNVWADAHDEFQLSRFTCGGESVIPIPASMFNGLSEDDFNDLLFQCSKAWKHIKNPKRLVIVLDDGNTYLTLNRRRLERAECIFDSITVIDNPPPIPVPDGGFLPLPSPPGPSPPRPNPGDPSGECNCVPGKPPAPCRPILFVLPEMLKSEMRRLQWNVDGDRAEPECWPWDDQHDDWNPHEFGDDPEIKDEIIDHLNPYHDGLFCEILRRAIAHAEHCLRGGDPEPDTPAGVMNSTIIVRLSKAAQDAGIKDHPCWKAFETALGRLTQQHPTLTWFIETV